MRARLASILAGWLCVACGPLGVGLGLNELFEDDPAPDLTDPSIAMLAAAPGTPLANAGPPPTVVTFRVRDPAAPPQPRLWQATDPDHPLRFVLATNEQGVGFEAWVLPLTGGGIAVEAGAVPIAIARHPGDESRWVAAVAHGALTPEGDWLFRARATDAAGNATTAEHRFFVDSSVPQVPPLLIEATALDSGTVRVSWLPSSESGVVGYALYWARGGVAIPDVRSEDRP